MKIFKGNAHIYSLIYFNENNCISYLVSNCKNIRIYIYIYTSPC